MMLTYKYRLYPSGKQRKILSNSLIACKSLYNLLLEMSIKEFSVSRKHFSRQEYNKIIKNKYHIHSQAAQNVSDRVSKAFKNFYRRIEDKKCNKKGFPRFKKYVYSITYPQSGFKFLTDKTLYVSKIGNIRINLHRIPKGKIKTMTIKQNKAGQFFACFACEVDIVKVQHKSREHIGIDVGIKTFAALSNGTLIENPKLLMKSEEKLAKFQRRLSRKKKGSKNRLKSRLKVARLHEKISNQRNDFLHKLSNNLTRTYNIISVEELQITNMVKNHCLAKHIHDASWNSFIQMLSYKAVKCGGQLIKAISRGTTKECSNCGNEMEMPLSKRIFSCDKCGIEIDRDINAAINIRAAPLSTCNICGTVGTAGTYTPAETGANTSNQSLASTVDEPGNDMQIHNLH